MSAHKRTAMRARIKRIWSELGYANRRMFDIRTGRHFMHDGRDEQPRTRAARRPAANAR